MVSSVRGALESVAAVERVLVDESQNTIGLICRPDADLSGVVVAVRLCLAEQGMEPDAWQLQLLLDQQHRPAGRVRFEGIEVVQETDARVRVRVTLEWDGERVTGEAAGERGATIELRTAVHAAITALEQLTGDSLDVRIAGVKQIRAFDAELMVVSLYRPSKPGQKLLGSVLMTGEPHRAAALALLNALNRLLGNYLSTR